jgi:hypothetical protein
MLSFNAFLIESNSNKEGRTDISWVHHPNLGVRSTVGFHKHGNLRATNPDFDPDDPSSTQGYAVIHHAPQKKMEVHAYYDRYGHRLEPHIKDDLRAQVVQHLSKNHKLVGYKVAPASKETRKRRDYGGD